MWQEAVSFRPFVGSSSPLSTSLIPSPAASAALAPTLPLGEGGEEGPEA